MPVPTPRRVLYCESNIDGTVGGSHSCLLNLIKRLDRTQFEPIVIFYDRHALVPAFQAAAEVLILEPDRPVQWASDSRTVLAAPARFLRRAINAVKLAVTVAEHVRFLRRQRIELVHLNNSVTRHLDWIVAALIARVPCVVHERGLNPAYTFVQRALASRLSLIIPMSQWIRTHMIDRGVSPTNIKVMYDGLDPESVTVRQTESAVRAQWNIEPGQTVIGMVGNIREWKGQDTVVRAVIEVVKSHPEVVCLFVGSATPGDRSFMDAIKGLIAEAGIESHIRFTSYQTDVPSLMNAMSLVIHASTLPEPFGMVVLEAMAQKKAVIGSRAGGVIEMVLEGETGYTFPPGDWKTLATRIVELLENPELRARMGERGYTRLMTSFTERQYMSQIHSAYREVLGQRHPAPDDQLQARRADAPTQ